MEYGSLMTRHSAILDSLGGHQRVASLLGLKVDTVLKWRVRGIPFRHWHRVIALQPNLTPEYLDRTKPRGVQSRHRRCEAAE
jgi:hypothetical protein